MTGRPMLTSTYSQALMSAFEALSFEFDMISDGTTARGYAEDGVVEIALDTGCTVSLLISVGSESAPGVRSGLCLATIAGVLGVDFTDWLRERMRRLGFDRSWKTSCFVDASIVSAEYFCEDVMLVTVVKSGNADSMS